MLNKKAGWRVALRKFIGSSKTRQSYYFMIKSRRFWSEIYRWRKLSLLTRVFPYTLVPYPGLSILYDLADRVEIEKVSGAMVECGVWMGGCAAILADFAVRDGRMTHLFDSFEGLPEPQAIDGVRAINKAGGKTSGALQPVNMVVAPFDRVRKTIYGHFGFSESKVLFHKGWFQETLPVVHESIGDIAVLRLDGDWYESTMVCLDYLYDHVASGGWVIIDDYHYFEGCRKATHDFFTKRGLNPQLHAIDWQGGVYFQKLS